MKWEMGADLFHGVHIGSCRLISFPWWLARDVGRHEHPLALFSRRIVLICVFGPSRATKEGRSFCRFCSLNGLRMTSGKLSIDLWE